jgi:glutamyl endopeptidase
MLKRSITRQRFELLFVVVLSLVIVQSAWAQAPSSRERAILRPGSSDTRVAVTNTYMYPFSAIARLVSTFPNGDQAVGSGALVGPNRVVTAGHMVYDREAGGYAKSIDVIPGYANGLAPFGKTHSTYVKTSLGYERSADPNFDFGMLVTADALGWTTGWLGLKATDNWDLGTVVLCGYPNDLGRTYSMYFAGGPAQWERGQNWWQPTHRLQYEFWTDSGMSGGPLINYSFFVVGIHTGGNSEHNYAVGIDAAYLGWQFN